MISEQDLVKGCLKGKSSYQEMLFNRYAPKMLAVCSRYFKSVEEAEDALQDGFIKVFTKLHDYTGAGSLEGWIRRIMVNTSLNLIRAQSKHYYHNDIDEIVEKIEDEMQSNDNLNTEEMMKLVQSMPEGYKIVFNLYEIEGYHHQEIADLLGISVNTSKSQLLKARRYLQKRILILFEGINEQRI